MKLEDEREAFSGQALEALRPGDLVAAKGPLGSFSAGGAEQLVCIAGGIGITPVRSILAEMFSERSAQPVTRRVTLLYGNADENDIAFPAELDEWEARHRLNFRLIHVVQRPGGRLKAYPGFVTADIIRREIFRRQHEGILPNGSGFYRAS